MIPFASQRGEGQDLATHLMNEHDNEQVELVDLRGSVAQDLHGAFAEWEAQAHNLTKCKNYLYSLSVNPDPAQGSLTQEQYLQYLEQVEEKLGLQDQPRAVVRHIKDGREHIHAVYSRIDAERGKAVHLAFDKDKLMMVTRIFAKSEGLELPEGYFKKKGDPSRDQLSLYEKSQQEATGLTKDERIEKVTECWQLSDSPKAFVAALEQNGYLLATGKRPYLLIDIYGHVNSLPKLIKDKKVRIKDIREFLKSDFPTESLPTVEEAKTLVARHHKAQQECEKSSRQSEQIEILKKQQSERREKLQEEVGVLNRQQKKVLSTMQSQVKAQFQALQKAYRSETERISKKRSKTKSQGLAAFLGKVTGMSLIVKNLRRHQDRKLLKHYLHCKAKLQVEHQTKEQELRQLHCLQSLESKRKDRALFALEQRELKSSQISFLKERRVDVHKDYDHMPPVAQELRYTQTSDEGRDDARPLSDIFGSASEHRAFRSKSGSGEDTGIRAYARKPGSYKKKAQTRKKKK